MKEYLKRIMCLAVALVAVLSATAFGTAQAHATETEADPHPVTAAKGKLVCEHCKGDPVTWKPLRVSDIDTTRKSGKSIKGGHYYLAEDIILGTEKMRQILLAESGDPVCLHLNGYSLKNTGGETEHMGILFRGILNVMGQGLIGGRGNSILGGAITSDPNYPMKVLNLYGGTFECLGGNGGRAVDVRFKQSVLNIYPGTKFIGNVLLRESDENNGAIANIYGGSFDSPLQFHTHQSTVESSSAVNIYGGTFHATCIIYETGTPPQTPAVVTIKGGGFAGAEVAVSAATVKISGGEFGETRNLEKLLDTDGCYGVAPSENWAKYKYQVVEHAYDEGTVTTPPTCKTAGEKLHKCTKCDATKTVEVPADPQAHTYGFTLKCTQDGCGVSWQYAVPAVIVAGGLLVLLVLVVVLIVTRRKR